MSQTAVAAPQTLREHIAAHNAAVQEQEQPTPAAEPQKPAAPAAAAAPIVPDEEAVKAEAESTKPDAELSEAGRKLRMNRADKRAERIRQENDELARELHRRSELRSELERFATAHPPATAGATPPPAGSTDPKDPEPTFDGWRDAHPNDPDPYTGWVKDHNKWSAREALRQVGQQSHAARQRATETQAVEAVMGKLAERSDSARAKFSDFDVVIEPAIAAIARNPNRERDVSAFIAGSEVGGEVMYRLGKDKTALQAVLSASTRTDLTRALLSVEMALTPPKTEDKPKTAAAAPLETVGGGSTATDAVDTRKGVDFKTHRRIHDAEELEARRRGLRY